jgi:cysteine-rich repeat protein
MDGGNLGYLLNRPYNLIKFYHTSGLNAGTAMVSASITVTGGNMDASSGGHWFIYEDINKNGDIEVTDHRLCELSTYNAGVFSSASCAGAPLANNDPWIYVVYEAYKLKSGVTMGQLAISANSLRFAGDNNGPSTQATIFPNWASPSNCADCHSRQSGQDIWYQDGGLSWCASVSLDSCASECAGTATSCYDAMHSCSTDICSCASSEISCVDAIDNDCDFNTDCADSDCIADPACTSCGPYETSCTDTIDNDCDFNTDCADSDCVADPACAGAPPNDECANSVAITDGGTTFTNIGSTEDGGSTACSTLSSGDIWYDYFATCDGTLTVDTCTDTDFDSLLVVYNGLSCPAIGEVVCNDDSCGAQSSLSLPVTQGEAYKIRVRGFYGPAFGSGTLTVSCSPSGAVCGNGAVEAGEQCDDSNTNNGDCCSSTCQFEGSGSSCATVPPNAANQCDGAGACVCKATETPESSCSDGKDNDCDDLVDGADSDCAPAPPDWWDTGWGYRVPVAITNTGGVLTDYQVLISLTPSFGYAKAKAGGEDIRVLADDQVTAIPFWIEDWNVGGTTNVWVKTSLAASSTKTVYVYYGNPAASSASNGFNVFEFFDDFEDGNTAGWTANEATISVITDGSKVAKMDSPPGGSQYPWNHFAVAGSISLQDYILEADYKTDNSADGLIPRYQDTLHWWGTEHFADFQVRGYYGNPTLYTNMCLVNGQTQSVGVWQEYKYVSRSNYLQEWSNGILRFTASTCLAAYTLTPPYKVGWATHRAFGPTYVDDIRVRKYVPTEPSSVLEGEELSVSVPDKDNRDGYGFLSGNVKVRANDDGSEGQYLVDSIGTPQDAVDACGGAALPEGYSFITLLDVTCPHPGSDSYDVWVTGARNLKWFHCVSNAWEGPFDATPEDWVSLTRCSPLAGGRAAGGKSVSAPAFDAIGLALFFALAAVAAVFVLANKK